MQKLSIQEQRNIIGGGWGFKAYDQYGNLVYFNFNFGSQGEATHYRNLTQNENPSWNVFSVEFR
ncbi:hypothetical protein [Lacrimispora algidixylanolytica]|uniref:Uncharacterized protein n=1 Tax=Lacrimispora algidixylanolytica TaxID=94868 RepID=A0A419T332_9FIRM|nr:hypothetical protein [Lacrimispora algidixylanolytica]RKD31849.1 hypothetical protein BET01_18945 [Lacrimispora algidixylanolytica]